MPDGLCECGCGERTSLSRQHRPERGQRKGEPVRYVLGHNNRGKGNLGFDAYDEVDLGHVTPCWIYRRVPGDAGYAQMRMPDGSQPTAHCAFYRHHGGVIPPGMTLDHRCHTDTECEGGLTCPHRRCVNPEHMEPTSRGENARRGKRTKLDVEKVVNIKYLLSAGWHMKGIASAYGVSEGAIYHIKRGTTWAHV